MVEVVFRESLLLIAIISGVPLLGCVITGLTISIFQAATQVQEQSVTFLVKLMTVGAMFILCGEWFVSEILNFIGGCLAGIQQVH
jgi:flagellar biosynthesis protein FliQ